MAARSMPWRAARSASSVAGRPGVRGVGKAEREPGRAAANILLRLLGCEVGVRVVDGLHDDPAGGRRGRAEGRCRCGPHRAAR